MRAQYMLALAGVATALLAMPAWAVNKCTQPDGQVVYQDAPCGNASKSSERVRTWDNTPGNYSGSPSMRSRIPPPKQVKWAGDPTSDLPQIEAEIEVTQLAGRDCEWGLKVHRDPEKCLKFASRVGRGGEHQQAIARLEALMKMEPRPPGLEGTMRRMLRPMEEVNRQMTFAMAWMRAQ